MKELLISCIVDNMQKGYFSGIKCISWARERAGGAAIIVEDLREESENVRLTIPLEDLTDEELIEIYTTQCCSRFS